MKPVYGKIAPKDEQPIRKNRIVFTSTKGFLKKQKWIILDMDEHGMTYRSQPGRYAKMFSSVYENLEEIVIDAHSFILTIKTKHDVYQIDLKRFDGDLWSNFQKIKTLLINFAGNIVLN